LAYFTNSFIGVVAFVFTKLLLRATILFPELALSSLLKHKLLETPFGFLSLFYLLLA
jgi:hypothetical protein